MGGRRLLPAVCGAGVRQAVDGLFAQRVLARFITASCHGCRHGTSVGASVRRWNPPHERSPQLSGLRFARVALSVATTVVVALAFAVAVAVAGSAPTKPTHFAGFPPVGVKASTPTTGRLLIGLSPTTTTGSTWNVYSDGRVIWQKWTSSGDATVVPDGARRLDTGYVQQRLTPRVCNYSCRRSWRPACSSKTSCSMSAATTHGPTTGFGEVIEW